MRFRNGLAVSLAIAACWFSGKSAAATNVVINYNFDTTNFFGAGNPQGATGGNQAKAALEAAASFYSTILTDSLSIIQTPPVFHSSSFDGQVVWHWTENFNNPSTAAPVVVNDPTVPANQYIVYVGARGLNGSEAGLGGPGGFGWSSNPTGGFSPQEIDQINATTNTFQSEVEHRGEASGFDRWGGTIAFDNDGSTNWFFNHLAQPSGNVTDFYSVAFHELAHTLGFGETIANSAWNSFISGSVFVGANSVAKNGGNAVPLSPDLAHWVQGTTSVVYGTATPQETVMDPSLQNGTRKKLTELDAAALKDIGWILGPAPGANGDYNGNGIVDAADYVVWRKNLNLNVTLPNDTTPGFVSSADYAVWRANFGNASGAGSGGGLSELGVPEPGNWLLVAMIACFAPFARPKRCPLM